jgi:VacB/RNase II family 3'-5' exoribonuclease
LGDCGSIPAETEAILSMNQVDTSPFAPEVLACLDEFQNWGITEQELAKRKDLRSECIFTCDPLTAKDLDDALSITQLPDGRFKGLSIFSASNRSVFFRLNDLFFLFIFRAVGVHIADVSHFVRPDTALDEEASRRCTTVYMVQKAIPMLPNLLCEQLCSLNQGVDRLAFSVEFLMNDDGTLVENEQPWFGKTVIRSCAKLDYGTVQEIIDGKIDYQNCDEAFASRPAYQQPEQPHSPSVIVEKSLQFHHLARQRRANRYANGALSLQRSKISFILDGEGKPIQWFTYVQKTANQMVEEFMLLGNELVARQIEKYTQSALLRCHPVPVEHKLQEYAKSISSVFGVDFQVASAGQVYQSLKTLTAGQTSAAVEMLLTHAMRPAEYFSIGVTADQSLWRHYALNMERYTHFTSPIRRYADVIVHRLLFASLCNGPVLPWEEVDKIAKVCSWFYSI